MRYIAGLILCVCLLSGCEWSRKPVAVRGRAPVIEMPKRPVLEKMTTVELVEYGALSDQVRKKLEKNNEALMVYAAELEVSVKEYNGYAKYVNQQSAAWVAGETVDPNEKKGGTK